jgi:rhodanese-related sulfurtransferase
VKICRTLSYLLLLAVLLSSGCRSMRNRERPPFRKITPAVAYELMRDNPDMLVIDLRAPQEFQGETGHLRRAVNIPLDRLPHRLIEISAWREETLLVYCLRGSCEQEGMAVLVSSGFENPILMEGGIDAWIEDGFKTELRGDIVGQTLRRGPTRPEDEEEKPATPPNQIPPPPPPPEAPPLDPPPP